MKLAHWRGPRASRATTDPRWKQQAKQERIADAKRISHGSERKGPRVVPTLPKLNLPEIKE